MKVATPVGAVDAGHCVHYIGSSFCVNAGTIRTISSGEGTGWFTPFHVAYLFKRPGHRGQIFTACCPNPISGDFVKNAKIGPTKAAEFKRVFSGQNSQTLIFRFGQQAVYS